MSDICCCHPTKMCLCCCPVLHPVLCEGCHRQSFTGFRYKCQRCFNYNLCQDCFWRGRTSANHHIDHQMKEHATYVSINKLVVSHSTVTGQKVYKFQTLLHKFQILLQNSEVIASNHLKMFSHKLTSLIRMERFSSILLHCIDRGNHTLTLNTVSTLILKRNLRL